LFDKIEINKIKKKKDKITFKGPFAKFIKNKDNTVNTLLQKLRDFNLISNYYSVIIKKNIPVFSGLGGGTSNAAFIFKYLLKNNVNKNLLIKFKNIIGSDFNLFFTKQGFLKNLQTVINFKKKHSFFFVLIQPKIKCSTREIYSNVGKFSKKEKFKKNFINSKSKYLEYLSKNRNDLQFIVERKYPFIKKLLTDIENVKGCYFARMTGSGSVCYGLFKDQNNAKKGLIKLKKKYPKFWFSLAKTV
jgi:4-diphosphocytidyl-2-C-methyl-D-erythritol kinase